MRVVRVVMVRVVITPSSQARNLGVIFDSTITLKPHISNIVRVYHHFISEILAK